MVPPPTRGQVMLATILGVTLIVMVMIGQIADYLHTEKK